MLRKTTGKWGIGVGGVTSELTADKVFFGFFGIHYILSTFVYV